jgi:hypothetical protein
MAVAASPTARNSLRFSCRSTGDQCRGIGDSEKLFAVFSPAPNDRRPLLTGFLGGSGSEIAGDGKGIDVDATGNLA